MNLLLKLPHDKALHIIVGVLVYAMAHFVSPEVGMAAVVVAAAPTSLLQSCFNFASKLLQTCFNTPVQTASTLLQKCFTFL